GSQQGREDAHGGGLAGPVRPEETEHAAFLDLQAETVEGADLVLARLVDLDQALGLDDAHGLAPVRYVMADPPRLPMSAQPDPRYRQVVSGPFPVDRGKRPQSSAGPRVRPLSPGPGPDSWRTGLRWSGATGPSRTRGHDAAPLPGPRPRRPRYPSFCRNESS